MMFSHRARREEKKLIRRLLFSILLCTGFLLLFLTFGLPLLGKIVIFFSSFEKRSVAQEQQRQETFLFPPQLDLIAEATNSSPIKIGGYGTKNGKVKIFVNNEEQDEVSTNDDGIFDPIEIELTEGENTITAVNIYDKKESSASSPIVVVFTKSTPLLELSSPEEGKTFRDEEKEISLIGKTDPGNILTVNDRVVIVNPSGNFSYRVRLTEGEQTFHLVARDKAGNSTELKRKVSYSS